MKNVLLVDTDSKIPNIALSKLSTFHKKQGNKVSLLKLGLSGYPGRQQQKIVDCSNYDTTLISTIFSHNRNKVKVVNAHNIEWGGSGIDIKKTLPKKVEKLPMDYEIYGEEKTSYGFITRGCNRNCSWCIVKEKEGELRFDNKIDQIINSGHKCVKFLDNNILAFPECESILQEIILKKIKCTFSQGLDIRCLTPEKAKLLEALSYHEEYIFAFDNIKLEPVINRKMSMLKDINFKGRMKFFIFTSPYFTTISDDVYRIKWCIKNNSLPYIMRENRCWGSNNTDFYIDIASWCNQPKIFKKMDFRTFLSKRHPKKLDRQKKSADIYFNNHSNMPDFFQGDLL